MFDSSYKFRYCNNTKSQKGQYHVVEHILTFSSKIKYRYIVHVEEYPHFVYVIKFHLKNHSKSDKKYNFETHIQDPLKVIGTCIEIMLDFYRKNPFASFAFIGANSILETNRRNTRRFKIYRRIMENSFSVITFKHFIYEDESAYFLLNKDNSESDLFIKIEQMFSSCFFKD